MTAWQVASIPFWMGGFILCFTAFAVGLGLKRSPKETTSDLIGQCGIGLLFGLPFLIVAAWMWR